MKLLRWIIGKIILFINVISLPKQGKRTNEEQSRVDKECENLTLYQFQACPFCIKVRRQIHRLNLKLSLADAKNDPNAREELLSGGGKLKVPCLKIESSENEVRWMYESSDINQYLEQRFPLN